METILGLGFFIFGVGFIVFFVGLVMWFNAHSNEYKPQQLKGKEELTKLSVKFIKVGAITFVSAIILLAIIIGGL
jgi:uncharacterized membrane protein YidH (DUF202 family)